MTKKLYYEDSYQTTFEAIVTSCEKYKEGYAIGLDETCFYPEGGGQPSDKGILDGQTVGYVYIKDEEIYHVVQQPITIGKRVKGEIDFKRRFDFMQQHSGEHIVSGVIHKHFGYNNVGFHLSEEYMTADLSGELTWEQLMEIERESNQAVFENVPIETKLFKPEEVQDIDYRSKIEITGLVRLVTIGEYDVCACCGTHVAQAGEIGIIKCVGLERHRGGVRLTLLCGKRALKDYQMKQSSILKSMTLLSSKPEYINDNLEKLQKEFSETKQRLNGLQEELFNFKAKEYVKDTGEVLCIYEEELLPEELRKMCLALNEYTDRICVVLTGKDQDVKYAIGSKDQDVRTFCKQLNAEFNGRGGGKQFLCQGSLAANIEDVREGLSRLL